MNPKSKCKVLSEVIIESTLINMHLTLTVNPTNFKYIK